MVAYSLWFYPASWVWPVRLSPMYELPARIDPLSLRFLLPIVGLVAVSVALVLLRKRWPGGLAAWTYSAVVVLPMSGVVHAGFQLANDRYSYLSGLGFAVLVGGGVAWVLRETANRRVSRPVAASALTSIALLVVALGVGSWQQSHLWRDSETLWRWGLEADPDCAICHHNLGVVLGTRGEWAEAQALMERAIALRPDRSEYHGGYGPLLIKMGRHSEGVAMLRHRLADNPADVNARANLGIALIEEGRLGEAIAELERALRDGPDSVPTRHALGRARLGLARAHLARGDRAGAREQVRALERLDPRLARQLEQEIGSAP
jgi:tetratricopeptide (TPR) repeat protein